MHLHDQFRPCFISIRTNALVWSGALRQVLGGVVGESYLTYFFLRNVWLHSTDDQPWVVALQTDLEILYGLAPDTQGTCFALGT